MGIDLSVRRCSCPSDDTEAHADYNGKVALDVFIDRNIAPDVHNNVFVRGFDGLAPRTHTW